MRRATLYRLSDKMKVSQVKQLLVELEQECIGQVLDYELYFSSAGNLILVVNIPEAQNLNTFGLWKEYVGLVE